MRKANEVLAEKHMAPVSKRVRNVTDDCVGVIGTLKELEKKVAMAGLQITCLSA